MSITQTHFISQIESYILVYCHSNYLVYAYAVFSECDGHEMANVNAYKNEHTALFAQIMMIMAMKIVQFRFEQNTKQTTAATAPTNKQTTEKSNRMAYKMEQKWLDTRLRSMYASAHNILCTVD